jgi:signal transduction histidine kinase
MTADRTPTLIEALAAGIAHEVRNPLNALQINVRILEQELEELVPDRTRSAHAHEVLAKIGQELHSLDAFITEFLRYARPPAPKIEPVRARALLGDLAVFITPECTKKGVTLRAQLERGPQTISADGFQLKHAVLNLILNALSATPPGGTIDLITSGEDALVIEVRDTGEGIPPELLDRVFEVFFTMREGGTGLGLPIARRIVAEHGGTLTLSSTAGAGTIARITIPVRA